MASRKVPRGTIPHPGELGCLFVVLIVGVLIGISIASFFESEQYERESVCWRCRGTDN